MAKARTEHIMGDESGRKVETGVGLGRDFSIVPCSSFSA
jgi:hypothetical protein